MLSMTIATYSHVIATKVPCITNVATHQQLHSQPNLSDLNANCEDHLLTRANALGTSSDVILLQPGTGILGELHGELTACRLIKHVVCIYIRSNFNA